MLQYWAEEANPLAPGEPHPLAMSVRELRQHIRKYTTFNEHDVFEGLGNAIPETNDGDTGTPPADSTASYAMTDVKDTQLSPPETQSADDTISPLPGCKSETKDEDMGTPPVDSTTSPTKTYAKDTQSGPVETPPVDDTTVLAAKPDAKIQKDLPATWGASPTKLEDLVPPTVVSEDNLAGPPTLASHTIKERHEYPQWIQVHSSQKVVAVGSVPYNPEKPSSAITAVQSGVKESNSSWKKNGRDLGDIFGSAHLKTPHSQHPGTKKVRVLTQRSAPPGLHC